MESNSIKPCSPLVLVFLISSLITIQSPVEMAYSEGMYEAAKVLEEYAKVCGSVEMVIFVLNFGVFLSFTHQSALIFVY